MVSKRCSSPLLCLQFNNDKLCNCCVVPPQAAEAAFSSGVEALCKAPVIQKAEVAPEVQLIRASVAFGLYIKKSCPELKSKVQNTMAAFLDRRVGSWVAENGGWVSTCVRVSVFRVS